MKKRIHNILLLIVALFSISSCSKPSTENVATLTIATKEGAPLNGASIVLASEGEQYLFAINSNTEWSIGCNAEWITFSATEGLGSSEVTVSADATMISRSAVVIIYTLNGQQIRASFNVVQHANAEQNPEEKPNQEPEDNPEQQPEDNPEQQPDDNPEQQPEDNPEQQPEDNPEQEPEDNPEQQPEDNPEQEPEDNPEQQPEDNPEQQPEDNPEQQPEDNPEQQPEDNPEQQPEDNPDQQPEDNPEQQPEDNPDSEIPNNSYSKIVDASFLQTGTYFIGGYQNGTLHLATSNISGGATPNIGHVHTTPYIYNDSDGTLSPAGAEQAIEVRLEAANNRDTYYIYFIGEGYLMATESNTGCLTFTDEPRHAWLFSNTDGGFEVRQQGDIDALLIVSRRATDRLIRSLAGDEDDGNPIVLFRKN